MVRKLNESDDYIKISKDYDDLVLRSIQIAKEMGIEQIIFQGKDGFFGSILAKNGKPVSPLNDGDKVIGKIRLVNRAGKTDAVYVTDYPAKESIKRSRKYNVGKAMGESRTRRTAKRPVVESKRDDIEYYVGILNDMYGIDESSPEILTIDSAYGKVRLVYEKQSTGSVHAITGYMQASALYEAVLGMVELKRVLG